MNGRRELVADGIAQNGAEVLHKQRVGDIRNYIAVQVLSVACLYLHLRRAWESPQDMVMLIILCILIILPLYWQVRAAVQAARPDDDRVTVGMQYVYVLQDMDVTGFYKIGAAMSAWHIGRFDTTLPFRIRVVHVIPTDDCTRLEAQLHRRFADKRQRGEWFALDAADVQAVLQTGGAQ